MGTVTLGPTPGWAVGETITAYARDSRGAATGSAVNTATVASDGTTTLDVADSGRWVATDGTVAVAFSTIPDSGPRGSVTWSTGGVPARPVGFRFVDWIGPDDPAENAVDGDTWTAPS